MKPRAPIAFAPPKNGNNFVLNSSRKSRRAGEHKSEGQKRADMVYMYGEAGRLALLKEDTAMIKEILKEYEPYVRIKNRISKGIAEKHLKMRNWFYGCLQDYITAEFQDATMETSKCV